MIVMDEVGFHPGSSNDDTPCVNVSTLGVKKLFDDPIRGDIRGQQYDQVMIPKALSFKDREDVYSLVWPTLGHHYDFIRHRIVYY
ncbi:hypothetical protein ACK8P5_26565 (plasmid) [Paenibacillus sp. EC2-1]|uniref:hypothetical protein n=1 Tax=Paenibacillus sp. EC2-1 TaxID=3388665 RepID=UPI003BEEB419